MKSAPMMKAWARPSGLGWTAYCRLMPHWLPSPSSCSKRGVSCGVEMIRMSLDAGQQERGQRVVDHRLVVDRQQLLGYRQGGGMEPGAGAAGEDEAFAGGHGRIDNQELEGFNRSPTM